MILTEKRIFELSNSDDKAVVASNANNLLWVEEVRRGYKVMSEKINQFM
jgi:hypothetical protein